MNIRNDTLLGLFDHHLRSFEISSPHWEYQWDREQWKTILSDILVTNRSDSGYLYGQVLLKPMVKDFRYEIVDGTNQIVTLIILMRSLANVYEARKVFPKGAKNIEKIFLGDKINKKLQLQNDDRQFFEATIIENLEDIQPSNSSQERIVNAKAYFADEFGQLRNALLGKLFNHLYSAYIIVIDSDIEGELLMISSTLNRSSTSIPL